MGVDSNSPAWCLGIARDVGGMRPHNQLNVLWLLCHYTHSLVLFIFRCCFFKIYMTYYCLPHRYYLLFQLILFLFRAHARCECVRHAMNERVVDGAVQRVVNREGVPICCCFFLKMLSDEWAAAKCTFISWNDAYLHSTPCRALHCRGCVASASVWAATMWWWMRLPLGPPPSSPPSIFLFKYLLGFMTPEWRQRCPFPTDITRWSVKESPGSVITKFCISTYTHLIHEWYVNWRCGGRFLQSSSFLSITTTIEQE